MSTPTRDGGLSSTARPADQGTLPLAARRRRRPFVLAGLLVLGVAAASVGAWWWFHTAPVTPPMPTNSEDPEVRRVLERARQEVLDKPRSAAAWGRLGMLFLAHILPGDADFCFAEAARLDPADARWVYARGLIALRRDPARPVTLLRRAVATGNPRPEERSTMTLQLAEALLERGELDEAEGIFRQEFERDAASARAAFGLGLIAVVRGDEPAATKFLTVAQNSPYARKKASAQLAALARRRGDGRAADAYQKQAAQLPEDPPWPDHILDEAVRLQTGRRGRERLANSLEKQKRYAEAAEVYLEQLERQPNVAAYLGAGMNLARMRAYDKAWPLLRKAVALDPDNAAAHYSLALALFARAEREWQTTPGSSQLKAWFREAVEHARRATKLRPSHAQAYLIWGLSLKYLGEPAAAVAPLREGVACAPADLDLQLGLGEVLLETGELKEAATHLENARRLAPTDPRPEQALKRLRQKKG
jgi:tetratricopeptide (TPR) repeat protein